MKVIYDGAVIPSYLGVSPRGSTEGSDDLLSNYVLRYGEVKAIVYPDDPASISKLQIEYEVEVQHRDGLGVSTSTLYRGVTSNSLFGGVADKVEMTYRPDEKVGSKVLLLCVSGDQQKAVILGGINPSTEKAEKQGHYLKFEFNGAKFTVNDAGEAEFLHRGATKADGSLAGDADASGAYIRFDAGGSVIISAPGGQQFIKLDHEREEVRAQANNLIVTTDNVTEITAKGHVNLFSEDETVIRGTQIKMNAAGERFVRGTTYRQEEGAMNQSLANTMSSSAAVLATIATQMTTAAALNSIPMVGGVLSAPMWISVATQMGTLGTNFASMATSINKFEAIGDQYVSDEIFGD